MARQQKRPASKITPAVDDERGDDKPGFGGEGDRSELGDGKPLDEATRQRNAEHNRQLEESAKKT